ncbi:uncharacterized protein LOC131842839 [Achroia grisella]|uniref:uncharacterized protein LOC131842839 n=1 Tax=Achroia grisella TaxID=688607 RepID=UPI0027D2B9C5|nr:uncharacterized protein LOC131842839 [Achroia grisella]
MRALAALTTVSAWCFALALTETRSREATSPFLLNILGLKSQIPVHRLFACGKTLGPTKCLSALSAWRAKNAIDAFQRDPQTRFNLTSDIEQFPWELYSNTTEDQLYSELCSGTEKLLQYRTLKFTLVPGYTLKLDSNGNGTLGVDVLRSNEVETARGSMKKKFYNIVPYLLLPGLIMSAILPFVLPALKLMTMGVVMLNNMAFTGAVFTLLRNNAFNDRYEHKVKYVNAGYKNEHLTYDHDDAYSHHYNNYDIKHSVDHVHEVVDDHGEYENAEAVEEIPANSDWLKQYYNEHEYVLAPQESVHIQNRKL